MKKQKPKAKKKAASRAKVSSKAKVANKAKVSSKAKVANKAKGSNRAKVANKPKPKVTKKAKGKVRQDLLTPPICTANFSAENGNSVAFTGIPAVGVRITQASLTDPFPFTPVTGTYNGLSYIDVATSGQVTVTVSQAATTTYYYKVNCSCPGDEGSHSVTVDT